jgi:hypothetical protein
VSLLATPTSYETTRLQTDTTKIGTFQVPAGTYSTLNVFITNSPSSVFVNASSSSILGCSAGAVCNLSGGAPGKISIDLTKAIGGSGLVLAANQNIGLGLEFNLNNAVTSTGGITLDLTLPNVFTVASLPRTGQTSGSLDTVDDFSGLVTAVSGTSITVKSDFRGSITASVTTTTALADPLSQCSGGASIGAGCIAVNSIVSVDAVVNTDGTFKATVIDLLTQAAATDELEGVFYPTTTANVYGLILTDKTVVSTNTVLAGAGSASAFFVTLDPSVTFHIDSKNLPVSPTGFSGPADVLIGQQVRARVTAATVGSNGINATANFLVLRPSKFTALVDHVGGNLLFLNTLPAYLGSFAVAVPVQTYTPQTLMDGVSAVTDLQPGQSVSVRALYLNNTTTPFIADKVRKH